MRGFWPTPQTEEMWQQGTVSDFSLPGFPRPGFPNPYDPWGASNLTKEEELNILKAEAEQIEDELFFIDQRIKELEGEKK
jgi:hypothetical protein